jgi:hypothetical protein
MTGNFAGELHGRIAMQVYWSVAIYGLLGGLQSILHCGLVGIRRLGIVLSNPRKGY